MKAIFTFFLFIASLYTQAQSICGTADEGGVVTLTAPAGYVFTSIDFASYGTPTGSCGNFELGGCHAENSVSIVEAVFLNMNSASINATNTVFGDPCSGTVKRLYIAATYSLALPLKLVSFSAQKTGSDQITLNWSSENETNTSHFIIEKSADGVSFTHAGNVAANGTGGHQYQFTTPMIAGIPVYFYRLKMVDQDGRFQYSNIVRIHNDNTAITFTVYPNPAGKFITITSPFNKQAVITNASGMIIKKFLLIKGSQTINIETWKAGIYFIKTEDGVKKIIKRQ